MERSERRHRTGLAVVALSLATATTFTLGSSVVRAQVGPPVDRSEYFRNGTTVMAASTANAFDSPYYSRGASLMSPVIVNALDPLPRATAISVPPPAPSVPAPDVPLSKVEVPMSSAIAKDDVIVSRSVAPVTNATVDAVPERTSAFERATPELERGMPESAASNEEPLPLAADPLAPVAVESSPSPPRNGAVSAAVESSVSTAASVGTAWAVILRWLTFLVGSLAILVVAFLSAAGAYGAVVKRRASSRQQPRHASG